MSTQGDVRVLLDFADPRDPGGPRVRHAFTQPLQVLQARALSEVAPVLLAAEAAARRAMEHGMRKVDVFVKGPGSGRETAIRSLQATGLEVGSIADVTPMPHNGTRPPKRRRV